VLRRYVITANYRTGSSAIAEAVAAHPHIACGWEWTKHTLPWQKIPAARRGLKRDFSLLLPRHQAWMAATVAKETQAIGYRQLFRASDKWLLHPRNAPALVIDRLEAHLRWWASDPEIHVIHIIRRDDIDWLKSKALAEAAGRFQGAYPESLKVSISPHEAARRIKTKHWIDARLATARHSNPYYRVTYESFRADNFAVAAQLVTFLGFDAGLLQPLKLKLQPQSREGSIKQIENLASLRAYLAGRGIETLELP
jgi:hypothetical protein